MNKWGYVAAVAAISMMGAQPCWAAEDFRDSPGSIRQTSAFAGVNVRLPLGLGARARPTARLQLTTGYSARNPSTGAVRNWQSPGLELGAQAGRPALFVGGQNAARIQRKANLSTVATVLLVGGALVLVLAVAAAASVPPQPDFDD